MSKQGTLSNLTLILSIVGLFIGGGGGYFLASNSYQPKIRDYENQINDLSTQVTTLNSTIYNLEAEISDYETQISELESQVSDLENQMTELETNLTDVKTVLSEKEDELEGLNEELKEFEYRVGERLNWKTYSEHDIYFEYPPSLDIAPMMTTEEIVVMMGMGVEEEEAYFFMMALSPNVNMSDYDEYLDLVMTQLEEEERLNITSTFRISSEAEGQEMKFQYFVAQNVDSDIPVSGIYAVWTCGNTNRDIEIMYYSSKEDVFGRFYLIIDSFRCHTPGASI